MNTLKRTLALALFCLLAALPAKALEMADVVSMQVQGMDKATIINIVAQQKVSRAPNYRDILLMRSRHASEQFLQFLCSPAAHPDRSSYVLGSPFDLQPLDLMTPLPRIQYYAPTPPPPPPHYQQGSSSGEMDAFFDLLFRLTDKDKKKNKKDDRHDDRRPPQNNPRDNNRPNGPPPRR